MLFSIGNIITILIVLIILALYRQLDRNNRSLDKVRRYSDKVTSDIEAFVDQKTQDMRNLAIEIDVHEKTGKEVLKRISSIEEGFRNKASEVDAINVRINEYDKAINELVGMTGKVDENLKRLHQESEFVDKVGKRLKDAQARMTGIEKAIPQLSEDFAVKNEKEMEKLRVELFSEVERQSAVVLDGIAQGRDRVEEFTEHLDNLEQRRDEAAEQAVRDISARVDGSIDEANEKLNQLNEDFKLSLDSLMATSDSRRVELSKQLDASESSFRKHVEEIGEMLSDKLVTFKDSINLLEETYQQNLKDSAEKARGLEDDVFASLKNYIEERSRDTRKQVNNIFEEMKKNALSYRNEIDNSFGEAQSEITVWRTTLKKDLDEGRTDVSERITAVEAGYNEQLSALKPKIEKMLEDIEAESRSLVEGTKGDVFRRVENMISNVNEKESRLSEFEENLAYKLTRIEEITADIDLLENNLKQMVDKAVGEVNEGFESIRDDMSSRWQRSQDALQTDISSTRETMSELESELDSLKSRAYDSVSEQLKVFEDSFFDDLREKSGLMEKRLEEWKQSVDDKLESISEESASAREQLEQAFNEDLNVKIVNLTDKTSGEFNRYEQQVDDYQHVIQGRLESIDLSIENLKTGLEQELSDANAELGSFLQSEMGKSRSSFEADITRFMRESETALREADEQNKQNRERIKQQVESQNSEIELWQARLRQQLSGMENEMTEQSAMMKSEVSEKISDVRELMSEQRRDFDSLSADILKRSREMQIELDQQLRGFDEKAAEINEGFALANKRMYEKIDEQSRELSFTLSEIESKQQGFIAQTKIFERADSLKEALENGISDLQVEITRVSSQAASIHEAEKKFASIKKSADDINEKMNKFAADRRRIEDIDADFKRLTAISQSVESRLKQVTSADDSLQLIQAKLMELDELQADIDGRYERLQKKETIVDTTIEGVDRSFKQLSELDHMISVISEKSSPLGSRLDELTRRIDFLSRNKKQIDAAISNIETIDSTLVDLEERIEKMQKAREWLAGTETRLEEVNKQAEEQVRLLGTLVKGSESKVKGGGAPPHEIRDVVIKLARQGWTVEQIAKSIQRSRGEVELILELQPKK
ncbi:MAG: hypothetical protein PQJ61_00645 [Spirochaetales bacterium]|uniref:Chromosome segregation ATPase n=1 Tax=Candidatus Thalassospirochaeta sargassi TaxID=3119039 RepID=A0AAJ1ID44_9SPIO|nr:hypothetical protein [Spirochaetales bacterium]